MRLIDANYVDASLEFYAAAHSPVEGKKEKIIYDTLQSCRKILGNATTIDAVPVVRCKECEYYNITCCSSGTGWCENMDMGVSDDFYCANGAKMEAQP